MNETLEFEGERYISSKRAAQLFGYTKDYVGQLCRGKKIEARLVGRTWYVSEKALRAHKLAVHHALHQPMHERQTKGLLPVETSEKVKVRATELEPRASRPRAIRLEPQAPRSTQGLSVLTHLDVSYVPEEPVYYEDDRPINPEPVRVTRFENTPIVAPTATARVRTVHTPAPSRAPVRLAQTQVQTSARSDGIAPMPVRRSGVPQRPVQDFGSPSAFPKAQLLGRAQEAHLVSQYPKTLPVVLGVLVGLAAVVGYVFFQ